MRRLCPSCTGGTSLQRQKCSMCGGLGELNVSEAHWTYNDTKKRTQPNRPMPGMREQLRGRLVA